MATSLAEQLRDQNEAGRARIPAEALAVLDQATAQVATSGIADSSLGVGAKVPDFSLPDATGTKVSLSSLLAKGPVVLAFCRGGRRRTATTPSACRSRPPTCSAPTGRSPGASPTPTTPSGQNPTMCSLPLRRCDG